MVIVSFDLLSTDFVGVVSEQADKDINIKVEAIKLQSHYK